MQDPITVFVAGDGAPPTTEAGVEVPFVIGEQQRPSARQAITDAGLEVEVVYIDRPAGDQYDDKVMDQNPRVPARLDEGETVTINVGRAADPPPQTNAAADPAADQPNRSRPSRRPTQPQPTRPTTRPPTTQRADHDAGGDDHDRTMTRHPAVGEADRAGDRQLPDRQPAARRPRRPRPGDDQASRRGGQPAPRRARARRRAGRRRSATPPGASRPASSTSSFPVDVYQTGSGTSTNMNVNEVIATLASQAARATGPPQRPRQCLAVVERRRAGGDPPRRDRRADSAHPPGARLLVDALRDLSRAHDAAPSRPGAPT